MFVDKNHQSNAKQKTSLMLAGMESAGKSALFRSLIGKTTWEEANFRGSTIRCKTGMAPDGFTEVVDMPGMRFGADAKTTDIALAELQYSDLTLIVVRGIDMTRELNDLLSGCRFEESRVAIVVTFYDKDSFRIDKLVEHYQKELYVPIVAINARNPDPDHIKKLWKAIYGARKIKTLNPSAPINDWRMIPNASWLEETLLGPIFSIVILFVGYGVPVYLAFHLAQSIQPFVDTAVIDPIVSLGNSILSSWISSLLVGRYGILTLGWYSFLWAFPVVAFMSLASALGEETGIQDRISRSLDPWMKRFGLSGRDLLPIMTGFGCNVVAIHQSRSCSGCTRRSCVTMISFGSACSYQIGATLSVFAAAGHQSLFFPYVLLLFVAGLLHTLFWNGGERAMTGAALHERSFVVRPRWQAVGFKIKGNLQQFIYQAMPIFLLICLVASLLDISGMLDRISLLFSPALEFFNLPSQAAPSLIFSLLRKDGILTINEGNGELVQSLNVGQMFILVWLASTISPCLVTLWTISSEIGLRLGVTLFLRQFGTSIFVAAALAIIFKILV